MKFRAPFIVLMLTLPAVGCDGAAVAQDLDGDAGPEADVVDNDN